jgi:hypothetical protein
MGEKGIRESIADAIQITNFFWYQISWKEFFLFFKISLTVESGAE